MLEEAAGDGFILWLGRHRESRGGKLGIGSTPKEEEENGLESPPKSREMKAKSGRWGRKGGEEMR